MSIDLGAVIQREAARREDERVQQLQKLSGFAMYWTYDGDSYLISVICPCGHEQSHISLLAMEPGQEDFFKQFKERQLIEHHCIAFPFCPHRPLWRMLTDDATLLNLLIAVNR